MDFDDLSSSLSGCDAAMASNPADDSHAPPKAPSELEEWQTLHFSLLLREHAFRTLMRRHWLGKVSVEQLQAERRQLWALRELADAAYQRLIRTG